MYKTALGILIACVVGYVTHIVSSVALASVLRAHPSSLALPYAITLILSLIVCGIAILLLRSKIPDFARGLRFGLLIVTVFLLGQAVYAFLYGCMPFCFL